MTALAKPLPTVEKCPYCKAERKIPVYAYAHWMEEMTVTCGAEGCGKKYKFLQGLTRKPRRMYSITEMMRSRA